MSPTFDPPRDTAAGEPASRADELRRLCAAASKLVDDLDSQRKRESAAFEEGYRLAFDAGREVGYRQAEADMEAAWKPVAQSVRNIPRQMQINENRRKPVETIPSYCTHRDCKALVDVPLRVDYRKVLCLTHAPKTRCETHRQYDACAYLARLKATQRREYTGGAVCWPPDICVGSCATCPNKTNEAVA